MRLFALALVTFGLNFAACDKKTETPEVPAAAATPAGDKPADPAAAPAAAEPAGAAEKPAEPAAAAADPVPAPAEPAPAAADPAAAAAPAAVAPAAELGITACDKYIKHAQGCIGQAPEATRAAQQQAFEQVVTAWKTQIAAQGDVVKPALEQGCASAYESAKQTMGSMCPGFTWE